jgi:hypothetical protein
VRGNLRAVCWKDKREVYVLSNIQIPPAEDNFKESGKAVKPLIIKDYTTHTGYAGLSNTVVNSYNISKKTWKWMEKLFFHLFNLTILKKLLCGKYDPSEILGTAA